ncbi:YebO family protein [Serratia fonticola]|uniref:YebO family protein n=1 Tax=Serratia fonticola TaxID=47917 RepID=UPI003AAFECCA
MDSMSGFWAITIFTWVIGLAITFFLVRFAVRADEQISILKEISAKQSELIKAMVPVKQSAPERTIQPADDGKTDAEYLAEARRKHGL